MRMPETMLNINGVAFQAHTLDVGPCCPVSHNPRPGSTLTIAYRPDAYKLEVAALYAYIHQYHGGLKDAAGTVIVRDMEGMMSRIAQDCANVLRVQVDVIARLVIVPKQDMLLVHRAYPECEAMV